MIISMRIHKMNSDLDEMIFFLDSNQTIHSVVQVPLNSGDGVSIGWILVGDDSTLQPLVCH